MLIEKENVWRHRRTVVETFKGSTQLYTFVRFNNRRIPRCRKKETPVENSWFEPQTQVGRAMRGGMRIVTRREKRNAVNHSRIETHSKRHTLQASLTLKRGLMWASFFLNCCFRIPQSGQCVGEFDVTARRHPSPLRGTWSWSWGKKTSVEPFRPEIGKESTWSQVQSVGRRQAVVCHNTATAFVHSWVEATCGVPLQKSVKNWRKPLLWAKMIKRWGVAKERVSWQGQRHARSARIPKLSLSLRKDRVWRRTRSRTPRDTRLRERVINPNCVAT